MIRFKLTFTYVYDLLGTQLLKKPGGLCRQESSLTQTSRFMLIIHNFKRMVFYIKHLFYVCEQLLCSPAVLNSPV